VNTVDFRVNHIVHILLKVQDRFKVVIDRRKYKKTVLTQYWDDVLVKIQECVNYGYLDTIKKFNGQQLLAASTKKRDKIILDYIAKLEKKQEDYHERW